MKVWATVVLPAQVEIDVPEDTPLNKIKELLLEKADLVWEGSGVDAIIHDCNIPELIN